MPRARATQFNSLAKVRHQLAKLYDRIEDNTAEDFAIERNKLKDQVIILSHIKSVLQIEQEIEQEKRLAALEAELLKELEDPEDLRHD